jgi:hypothetical protein
VKILIIKTIGWFILNKIYGVNWQDVWRDTLQGAKTGAIIGGLTGAVSGAFRADPVNAVHGYVYYNLTDFEYPGIIPMEWERSWCSQNVLLAHVIPKNASILRDSVVNQPLCRQRQAPGRFRV